MKLTTRQIFKGEDEIIIRYKTMTPELEALIRMIQQGQPMVLGRSKERQYRIPPQDIYYFECVDEKLFAYTRDSEFQVAMTLAETEEQLAPYGFFRCNKSFVMNINKVAEVKSEMGNRIDAVLDNGEHVIISRHYAREFRELLKGEKKHE